MTIQLVFYYLIFKYMYASNIFFPKNVGGAENFIWFAIFNIVIVSGPIKGLEKL